MKRSSSRFARWSPTAYVLAAVIAVGLTPTTSNDAAAFSDSGSGATVVVVDMIQGAKFAPVDVTVRVGDTVEWRNLSAIAHTVTTDRSRALNPDDAALPEGVEPFDEKVWGGKVFRYTFTEPGLYRYVCLPHERQGMIGSVTVEPAA